MLFPYIFQWGFFFNLLYRFVMFFFFQYFNCYEFFCFIHDGKIRMFIYHSLDNFSCLSSSCVLMLMVFERRELMHASYHLGLTPRVLKFSFVLQNSLRACLYMYIYFPPLMLQGILISFSYLPAIFIPHWKRKIIVHILFILICMYIN